MFSQGHDAVGGRARELPRGDQEPQWTDGGRRTRTAPAAQAGDAPGATSAIALVVTKRSGARDGADLAGAPREPDRLGFRAGGRRQLRVRRGARSRWGDLDVVEAAPKVADRRGDHAQELVPIDLREAMQHV